MPYPETTKIKIRLFDPQGKGGHATINTNFFSNLNALIIMFDLTDVKSFQNLQNFINTSKTFIEICKKNKYETQEKMIKQPESFNDIPISIIGNKLDLSNERKVQKQQIDEIISKLKNEGNLTNLNYYEISVKDNINIEKIFQDIIFYYFKRNFEPIAYKVKQANNQSNENSSQDLANLNKNNTDNSNNNLINIENANDWSQKDLILENKKIKKDRKKKPSLEKSLVLYHQMIIKAKKQFYNEINQLKNENNILKQKMYIIEKKNKELEEIIKLKGYENIKENNNENLDKDEISLKFLIAKENINEIVIKTKRDKKMSEVISNLYQLCPYICNLKVKYFCLEGNENNKIDEMKTIDENNLLDGSFITFVI